MALIKLGNERRKLAARQRHHIVALARTPLTLRTFVASFQIDMTLLSCNVMASNVPRETVLDYMMCVNAFVPIL